MKSLKLLIIISTVMLILIPARGQATETLYGITFDQQLITINSSTGLGNLVGNLDTAMGGFGLATRSGKLYTFDQTADRIRELDPLTAHTLNTINNDYYEQLVISSQQIGALKNPANLMPIVGGVLSVPEAPGIGYMPDWAWLEKNAVAIV